MFHQFYQIPRRRRNSLTTFHSRFTRRPYAPNLNLTYEDLTRKTNEKRKEFNTMNQYKFLTKQASIQYTYSLKVDKNVFPKFRLHNTQKKRHTRRERRERTQTTKLQFTEQTKG